MTDRQAKKLKPELTREQEWDDLMSIETMLNDEATKAAAERGHMIACIAKKIWCSGDVYIGPGIDSLEKFFLEAYEAGSAAERERLESSIHSCGPHCSRPACVATRRAVEEERERLRAMLVRHRDQTVQSHHVTLAECHAARNALQLVIDEWS